VRYRIGLNGWIFFSAALMILAVALLLIGIQTIKAAIANPVEILRSE
jgi:putative ABC transport system permease protein